jgi:N-acetylmuramoyl-L-alanine amidase
VDFEVVNDSCNLDISLGDRARYANWHHDRHGSVITWLLHINAVGNGSKWHQAQGARILHYSKRTAHLAEAMAESFRVNTQFASTQVKRAGFFSARVRPGLYMLRKPNHPSIIIEGGWMTNEFEAYYLANGSGVVDYADAVKCGVLRVEGIDG